MSTAADSLQLVFCASTVTAAVRAGWCTTATPALAAPPRPPRPLPAPTPLVVGWA